MKQILFLLAAVLLLGGCAEEKTSHHSYAIGIFGQPESIGVQHLIFVLTIEKRRIFTCCLPVITSHTDTIVFGQACAKILKLAMQDFLHTDNIQLMVLNKLAHTVFPILPIVQTVLRIVVTDIESSPTNVGLLLFRTACLLYTSTSPRDS